MKTLSLLRPFVSGGLTQATDEGTQLMITGLDGSLKTINLTNSELKALQVRAAEFNAFLCTSDRAGQASQASDLAQAVQHYPQRWHIEEFFNAYQALGWNRAGTLNLHIRYGQMTMALIAQAAIHQLRQRLGEPFRSWDAAHLAKSLLNGLEGDIRVNNDTILVTYYNAPNADLLRPHYENLPKKLSEEGIDPHIPWLYNFKLDFRFK